MSKKILNVATFGLAGALLKPFGKDKKKEAPKAPEAGPVVMPLADGQKIRDARRKSIIQQMSRSGRASTILSDPSERLGG